MPRYFVHFQGCSLLFWLKNTPYQLKYHNHPAPIFQNEIKEEIAEKTNQNRKHKKTKIP